MKKSVRKIYAFLTLVSFLASQTAQVVPAQAAPVSEVIPAVSFDLDLPPDLGTIDYLKSGSGPALVHIQTAHGNFEAQKKIQGILHHLYDRYGIRHVFIEGSAYKLRPELLRLFPEDMPLTMEIAESLTRKSLVKGEELFLLEAQDAEAYGIEDIDSYRANGAAFKDVLEAQEKTAAFLADMNLQIERLTSPYLNKDLRAFLGRLDNFESKNLPLPEWLTFLRGEALRRLEMNLTDAAHQIDWPMLVRLFTLGEIEKKLDSSAFVHEREAFIEAIANVPAPVRQRIEQLLSSPVSRHQLPDPETGILFEKMVEALPHDFNYAAYPNVRLFIGHLILQSEIKGSLLMDEIEKLSDKIAAHLAVTAEEKKILGLLKDYRLLNKLFALELIPSDYEKIVARSAGMRPDAMIARFKGLNGNQRVKDIRFEHLEEINALYDKALAFYRTTQERDLGMTANLAARMQELGAEKAAVITGGFHAEPFRRFFESQGYHYALVSPKITTADGREAYVESVLHREPTIFTQATRNTPPNYLQWLTELRGLGLDSPDLLYHEGHLAQDYMAALASRKRLHQAADYNRTERSRHTGVRAAVTRDAQNRPAVEWTINPVEDGLVTAPVAVQVPTQIRKRMIVAEDLVPDFTGAKRSEVRTAPDVEEIEYPYVFGDLIADSKTQIPLEMDVMLAEEYRVQFYLTAESRKPVEAGQVPDKLIYSVQRSDQEISTLTLQIDRRSGKADMAYFPSGWDKTTYRSTLTRIDSWMQGIVKSGQPFNAAHPALQKRSEVRGDVITVKLRQDGKVGDWHFWIKDAPKSDSVRLYAMQESKNDSESLMNGPVSATFSKPGEQHTLESDAVGGEVLVKLVAIAGDTAVFEINPDTEEEEGRFNFEEDIDGPRSEVRQSKAPGFLKTDWTVPVQDLDDGGRALNSVALSGDGAKIATASEGGAVSVWDVQKGRKLFTLKGDKYEVHGVAFSSDSAKIASAGHEGTVIVWDAKKGTKLLTYDHDKSVKSVAFSPDNTKIATASRDGKVRIWNAKKETLLFLLDHSERVEEVVFSGDGTKIASADLGGTVIVWDAKKGTKLFTLDDSAGQRIAFSPDNTKIAAALEFQNLGGFVHHVINVYDAKKGKKLFSFEGHPINSLAFSNDSTKLAGAGTDGIRFWDVQKGTQLFTLIRKELANWVNSVVFSKDGTKIVGAGQDGFVRIWDLSSVPAAIFSRSEVRQQVTLQAGSPAQSVAGFYLQLRESEGKRILHYWEDADPDSIGAGYRGEIELEVGQEHMLDFGVTHVTLLSYGRGSATIEVEVRSEVRISPAGIIRDLEAISLPGTFQGDLRGVIQRVRNGELADAQKEIDSIIVKSQPAQGRPGFDQLPAEIAKLQAVKDKLAARSEVRLLKANLAASNETVFPSPSEEALKALPPGEYFHFESSATGIQQTLVYRLPEAATLIETIQALRKQTPFNRFRLVQIAAASLDDRRDVEISDLIRKYRADGQMQKLPLQAGDLLQVDFQFFESHRSDEEILNRRSEVRAVTIEELPRFLNEALEAVAASRFIKPEKSEKITVVYEDQELIFTFVQNGREIQGSAPSDALTFGQAATALLRKREGGFAQTLRFLVIQDPKKRRVVIQKAPTAPARTETESADTILVEIVEPAVPAKAAPALPPFAENGAHLQFVDIAKDADIDKLPDGKDEDVMEPLSQLVAGRNDLSAFMLLRSREDLKTPANIQWVVLPAKRDAVLVRLLIRDMIKNTFGRGNYDLHAGLYKLADNAPGDLLKRLDGKSAGKALLMIRRDDKPGDEFPGPGRGGPSVPRPVAPPHKDASVALDRPEDIERIRQEARSLVIGDAARSEVRTGPEEIAVMLDASTLPGTFQARLRSVAQIARNGDLARARVELAQLITDSESIQAISGFTNLPEEIRKLRQVQLLLDRYKVQATQVEVEKGVAYFTGKIATDPVKAAFRPSRTSDLVSLSALSEEQRRHYMEIALASLAAGEGVFSNAAAGAAARMNVKEAPEIVREMSVEVHGDGHELESKAAVPVGRYGSRVYTFLGLMLSNIARLQNAIRQIAPDSIPNDVLIMTNALYQEELERELERQSYYGLSPDQFWHHDGQIGFQQDLGVKYYVNEKDATKVYEAILKTAGSDAKKRAELEAKYRPRLEAAIARAHWIEKEIAEGRPEAVVHPTERDPLGHGEFFHQMVSKGILLDIIEREKKWISFRNIDNTAATFGEDWLVSLGIFLEEGRDMQPEVSLRIPGQKGGGLIVTESGSHQLTEDPSFEATFNAMLRELKDAGLVRQWEQIEGKWQIPPAAVEELLNRIEQDGSVEILSSRMNIEGEVIQDADELKKLIADNRVVVLRTAAGKLQVYRIVTSLDTAGFNDAVALFSPWYIVDIYRRPGQTREQFLEEMRRARAEGTLEELAERGRARFPKLIDPKPARDEAVLGLAKIETNMWQSTAAVPETTRITAVAVHGIAGINVEDYLKLSPAEQDRVMEHVRMLATKQWSGPAESYQSNRPFIDAILRNTFEKPLFPEDVRIASSEVRTISPKRIADEQRQAEELRRTPEVIGEEKKETVTPQGEIRQAEEEITEAVRREEAVRAERETPAVEGPEKSGIGQDPLRAASPVEKTAGKKLLPWFIFPRLRQTAGAAPQAGGGLIPVKFSNLQPLADVPGLPPEIRLYSAAIPEGAQQILPLLPKPVQNGLEKQIQNQETAGPPQILILEDTETRQLEIAAFVLPYIPFTLPQQRVTRQVIEEAVRRITPEVPNIRPVQLPLAPRVLEDEFEPLRRDLRATAPQPEILLTQLLLRQTGIPQNLIPDAVTRLENQDIRLISAANRLFLSGVIDLSGPNAAELLAFIDSIFNLGVQLQTGTRGFNPDVFAQNFTAARETLTQLLTVQARLAELALARARESGSVLASAGVEITLESSNETARIFRVGVPVQIQDPRSVSLRNPEFFQGNQIFRFEVRNNGTIKARSEVRSQNFPLPVVEDINYYTTQESSREFAIASTASLTTLILAFDFLNTPARPGLNEEVSLFSLGEIGVPSRFTTDVLNEFEIYGYQTSRIPPSLVTIADFESESPTEQIPLALIAGKQVLTFAIAPEVRSQLQRPTIIPALINAGLLPPDAEIFHLPAVPRRVVFNPNYRKLSLVLDLNVESGLQEQIQSLSQLSSRQSRRLTDTVKKIQLGRLQSAESLAAGLAKSSETLDPYLRGVVSELNAQLQRDRIEQARFALSVLQTSLLPQLAGIKSRNFRNQLQAIQPNLETALEDSDTARAAVSLKTLAEALRSVKKSSPDLAVRADILEEQLVLLQEVLAGRSRSEVRLLLAEPATTVPAIPETESAVRIRAEQALTGSQRVVTEVFRYGILPLSVYFRLIQANIYDAAAVVSDVLGRPAFAESLQPSRESEIVNILGAGQVILGPRLAPAVSAVETGVAGEAKAPAVRGQGLVLYDTLQLFIRKSPRSLALLLEGFQQRQAALKSAEPLLGTLLPAGVTTAQFTNDLVKALRHADSGVAQEDVRHTLAGAIRLIELAAGENAETAINRLIEENGYGVAVLGTGDLSAIKGEAVFEISEDLNARDLPAIPVAALIASRGAELIAGEERPEIRATKLSEYVAQNLPGFKRDGNRFVLTFIASLIQFLTAQNYIDTRA